ncbi:hypothetical protein J6590_096439 [Homalodisca vitripennis]|nr:hypothetical protein J6590_096439 [Homalodisca vitripennis]
MKRYIQRVGLSMLTEPMFSVGVVDGDGEAPQQWLPHSSRAQSSQRSTVRPTVLARLLRSVEIEENEVLGRPTGAFARQLFNESDEEDTNVAGSDDDKGHVHLAQEWKAMMCKGMKKVVYF